MEPSHDEEALSLRELDKRKTIAFLRGCGFERCLSPDCPNFIGDQRELEHLRKDPAKSIEHALKMLRADALRLSCVPGGAKLPSDLEKFQRIIDYSFHRAMNCSYEEMSLLAEGFRRAAEDLIAASPEVQKRVAELFQQEREIEMDSISKLLLAKVDIKLSAALVQFVPMFWFCFEIEIFDSMKAFKNLLSKISLDWIFSDELLDMKGYIVRSPICFELSIEHLQNRLTMAVMEVPDYLLNPSKNKELRLVSGTLSFLNEANNMFPGNEIVRKELFENESVACETDLEKQLTVFLKGSLPRRLETEVIALEQRNPQLHDFNFLNYPFLLQLEKKDDLLKKWTILLQDVEIEKLLFANSFAFDSFLSPSKYYFPLRVRRSHIFEDSVAKLERNHNNLQDLKKPLEVTFLGESSDDPVGNINEYFQSVTSLIFSQKEDMFVLKNDRFWWFNPNSRSSPEKFKTAGIIIGLALFNRVILGVNIASAVFTKLRLSSELSSMGDQLNLEALAEIEPDIAISLQNLIKSDLSEPEFPLHFSIDAPSEESKIHELVPQGGRLLVTNDNKNEYVKRYVGWALRESVEAQFGPFCEGFLSIFDRSILKLFSASEISLELMGKEIADLEELKHSAKYEGGYSESSPTIINFWRVLNDFDDRQKKDFLKFLTGSSRIPLRGLPSIQLVIIKAKGDASRLPQLQTCFNRLLLPDYPSLEQLREKLLQAVLQPTGISQF